MDIKVGDVLAGMEVASAPAGSAFTDPSGQVRVLDSPSSERFTDGSGIDEESDYRVIHVPERTSLLPLRILGDTRQRLLVEEAERRGFGAFLAVGTGHIWITADEVRDVIAALQETVKDRHFVGERLGEEEPGEEIIEMIDAEGDHWYRRPGAWKNPDHLWSMNVNHEYGILGWDAIKRFAPFTVVEVND